MNEKLNQVIEEIKQKTKKECYSIVLLDDKPTIADSKIGGIPYMSINESYPKDSKGNDMPLFIQINFERLNLQNYPNKGLLQLFVDKNFSYPTEYKVRYIENIIESNNDELPKIDLSNFAVKDSIKIELIPNETYMPINDFRFNNVFCEVFNKIYKSSITHYFDSDEATGIENGYEIVYDAFKIESGLVGGYADFTQSDPRDYNKSLKEMTECIIKIDSNLDKRIIIGDAGISWLIISEEDLKLRNFENANFDWDCL